MKKIFVITFLVIIILGVFNFAYGLSKIGSRGEEVKQIQTKLKAWGYYNGTIDGIYGTNTSTSAWIWSRPQVITIGRHIFCK